MFYLYGINGFFIMVWLTLCVCCKGTGGANQDEQMDVHDNSKDETNDNQDNTETKPKEDSTSGAVVEDNNPVKKRVCDSFL